MTDSNAPSNFAKPVASRYRLWVDGCGGFLLVVGDRVTLGRGENASPLVKSPAPRHCDVGVIGDWPRFVGTIDRRGGDYFWTSADTASSTLLSANQPLPATGSVSIDLRLPSPLSASSVMTITGPHRFADHVDAVVLVDQTIVVGSGTDCHVRVRQAAERSVLIHADGKWFVKHGAAGARQPIQLSQSISAGDFTMTLETT